MFNIKKYILLHSIDIFITNKQMVFLIDIDDHRLWAPEMIMMRRYPCAAIIFKKVIIIFRRRRYICFTIRVARILFIDVMLKHIKLDLSQNKQPYPKHIIS